MLRVLRMRGGSENVGPWRRDRRLEACAELVRMAGYGLDQALERGVSPGFLAVVLESNLEEVLDRELEWAIKCGELECELCEKYFSRKEARVEDDVAYCPECGRELHSECCALCGCDLYDGAGEWRGQYVRGFCFCPECAGAAEAAVQRRAQAREE